MADMIREAPLGQFLRYVTKNKVLLYPEEKADFVLPAAYHPEVVNEKPQQRPALEAVEESSDDGPDLEKYDTKQDVEEYEPTEARRNLTRTSTTRTGERPHLDRVVSSRAYGRTDTHTDLEQAITAATLKETKSRPIEPQRTAEGVVLVDWYTTDDCSNPQNWSLGKKAWASLVICLYTTAVYMGSSIYTASEIGVMQRFGVNVQLASMGLSMYVFGYGLGPMLWSPLSEIPVIGRNPPYVLTYAIFVILCVPTALVDNFPGLIVLRFLQGFFGSPCLATGGASLQDMFSLIKIPYILALWAFAATCGPALGPTISGFSVIAENWRWSLWEMLWASGPVWIAMFLTLPETNPSTILLRRAQRLRKLTGNTNMKAQSEIDQANMKPRDVALEAIYRPILLFVLDPVIAFVTIYTGLIYGIYYSCFESFPIVYLEIYKFNFGQMGLAFLAITVGVIVAIGIYWTYYHIVMEPKLLKNAVKEPEEWLVPALAASFALPIGLFMFAWTSREAVHWIVPTIGIAIFSVGIFIVMNVIFVYLPLNYSAYAASLFALNDLARSSLASGAIHFSRPLYGNLGVGAATSLLAGLTAGCIVGMFVLYFKGGWLRSRSRFTNKN